MKPKFAKAPDPRFVAGLLIVATICLAACSRPGSTAALPPAVAPPESETAATPEPLGEETVTLKVVSFNVLYGAGHDRRYDMNIPERFRGRDRLPQLIAFLDAIDADVISMQEAGGLDTGNPSVADQIAARLGMSYVIAHDAWDLHVIVFSKFPIVAADYVSRDQGFNGVALRTTLRVTATIEIDLLAVHLNSMSSATRACQVEALLDIAANGRGAATIMAGDMNFRPGSAQAEQLTSRGWQLVVAQPTWPIDQIWAGPGAVVSAGEWWRAFTPPADISDHLPVGVDVTLTLPGRRLASPPTGVTPGRLSYACPLPTPRP